MGDYSISKAGELMLTRQFAVEMAEFGITVNAIAPTLTRTEFSRWQWEDDAELDKVVRNLPIKRLAEPEDTAGLAAFLASEAASMITGAIIPVDGGSLA
jgi:NAD(P)-dependent dehydrogenase (short-subunit alcohol dehydrogenase family)